MPNIKILSDTNLRNFISISTIDSPLFSKIKSILFRIKRWFVPPNRNELVGRALLLDRGHFAQDSRSEIDFIKKALRVANRNIPFIHDLAELEKVKPGQERLLEVSNGYAYIQREGAKFNVQVVFSKVSEDSNNTVHLTAKYKQVSREELAKIAAGEKPEDVEPEISVEKVTRSKVKVAWKLVKGIVEPKEEPLKLKVILSDLATLYDEVKYKILTDTDSYLALNRLLRSASREMLEAFEKGKITKEERDALIPQLEIIEEALENASYPSTEFPPVTSEMMKGFFKSPPNVGPIPIDWVEGSVPSEKIEKPSASVAFVKPINTLEALSEMLDGPFDVEKIMAIDFHVVEGEIWSEFKRGLKKLESHDTEKKVPKPTLNEAHFLSDSKRAQELWDKLYVKFVNQLNAYKNIDNADHPANLAALAKLLGILQFLYRNSVKVEAIDTVLGYLKTKMPFFKDLSGVVQPGYVNPEYLRDLRRVYLSQPYLQGYRAGNEGYNIYGSDIFPSEWKKNTLEEAEKFARPITNPFLRALSSKYVFRDRYEDHQEIIEDRRAFGRLSEEAIMDDPEGVAFFVLDLLNDTLKAEGKETISYIPKWDTQDLQALFVMAREVFGQTQIIDSIEKRPGLLKDPEVRNLISNLFFRGDLVDTLEDNEPFRKSLPGWIEAKIEQFNDDIEIKLFFLEMHEKVKTTYEQLGYKDAFKEYDLNELPKNKSLNLIYTLNLAKKLKKNVLTPDEVEEVMGQYHYLIDHPLDLLNREPLRDSFIRRRMNALYDALKIEERKPEFPQEILNDPRLADLIGHKFTFEAANIEGREVFHIHCGKKEIQVQKVKGEIHIYRNVKGFDHMLEELDSGKLLESARPGLNEVVHKQLEALMEPPFASRKKLIQILDFIRGDYSKYLTPELPRVMSRLYANPKEPHLFHSLSETGEVLYDLEVRNGELVSIMDKREDSGPWKLVPSHRITHPALNRLREFEREGDILAYAKEGVIERVVMPRLNLQFEVRGTELYGKGPYEGYRLDFTGPRPLPLSLRLISDDETKPVKLIVPAAKGLSKETRALALHENSFIATIYEIVNRLRKSLHGDLEFNFTEDYQLDSEKETIETYTLDIHPVTGEFNRSRDPIPLLEALQQAVAVQDLGLAYRLYKDLNLTEHDLKKKVVDRLQFIFKTTDGLEARAFYRLVASHLKSIMGDAEKYRLLVEKIDKIEPETEVEAKKRRRLREFVPIPEYSDKLETPPPYNPKPTAITVESGEPLLFSSAITNLYFKETASPEAPITLPEPESGAMRCEKAAIREVNEHLKKHAPNAVKVEFKHKDLFLSRQLNPKMAWLEKEEADSLRAVHNLLYRSEDKEEELAILSGRKAIASETDLMLALLQNDLKSLAPFLPKDCDLGKLKGTLILYYDAKIKLHHAKILKQAIAEGADPKIIREVLVRGRKYDPEVHPELLVFEVMSFVTFRNLSAKDQLELLKQVLEDPNALVLAPTGSGKTMLISVIRALMRANGQNLVTQKVLPTLFSQTLKQMESLLGEVLRKKVVAFRYDPKFKPTVNVEGKTRSAFTFMYQDLLRCIRDKGVLVTDYKSMPLLEEKFFSLSYELNSLRKMNEPIPPLEIEHWNSLRQILLLLKNNEEQMMDEFDEPNRPVHRIQMAIPGAKGEPPAPFMLEESFRLYERLMEEKDLYLKQNLQGDIPDEEREAIIEKIAKEYADGNRDLENYFLGKSEEILKELDRAPPEMRDRVAFLKDQFTTFLLLCLSNSHGSRYKRSDDGRRLLPCDLGTPHEAKFGNIIEEINYTNQEYIQAGVKASEIQDWLKNIEYNQEAFDNLFPIGDMKGTTEALVSIANESPAIRRFFWRRALDRLKINGAVASMNPHNCASMAKAVSGVSATMGEPEALSSSFTFDTEEIGQVQSEMIYRFVSRTKGNDSLLEYDPADPLKLLDEANDASALIDGAGAFKEVAPDKVGDRFRAGYHDEAGEVQNAGEEQFYFAQAYTRGTDRKFKPGAKALLTVNGKGTLEQLNQQEGRMRLEGQKIRVARSKYNPEIKDVRTVLQAKVRFQARKRAKDLFESKKHEVDSLLRSEIKGALLPIKDIVPYLEAFDKVQKEFITEPASNYNTPGAYYEKHKHLVVLDSDPVKALEAHRDKRAGVALALKLDNAEERLKKIAYPESLRDKLPDQVASLAPETEIEVELEEELQLEAEREQELALELEQEEEVEEEKPRRDEGRIYVGRKVATGYSGHMHVHKAFSYLTGLEGRFQPVKGAYPGARKVFGPSMFRVNCAYVHHHLGSYWFEVGDRIAFSREGGRLALSKNFVYDFDRDEVIQDYGDKSWEKAFKTAEFISCAAQMKFLDGRIEGYREREVEQLKKWLKENKPKELFDFFLNRVLRHREADRDKFPTSQLAKVFESLGCAV